MFTRKNPKHERIVKRDHMDKVSETGVCNKKTLEIGVYSAVLEFNDGKRGIEKAMIKAGLNIGTFQSALSEKVVRRHKRTIQQKSCEKGKKEGRTSGQLKRNGLIRMRNRRVKCMKLGGFKVFLLVIC
jgi:hypothetical protein